MRLLPILLLAACGGRQLEITVDGVLADRSTIVDLGQTRRHRIANGARVQLANAGSGRVIIETIDLPLGVSLARPDLPIELPGGESAELRLGLIALEVGEVAGDVVFDGNTPASLRVEGSVTPYIQLDVQPDPALDQAFDEALAQDGAVGAAAAIIEAQDIVWMRGYGLADREANIPVDPRVHRFRWASLSKGLVALTTAHAVEEGELDFDDEIEDLIAGYETPSTYLPEDCRSVDCAEPIPDDAAPLTMRQLLSHTGGIQHYSNGAGAAAPFSSEANDPEINTGMAWALDRWTDNPLVAPPGTVYSYSTFGYNLAGVALEEAIGDPLGAAVEERVSEPLGITTLGPDLHWDPAPDRVAHYRLDEGEVLLDGDNDVSWKLAGGGFTSTVEDLARYCSGMLGDVVVRPRTRDEVLWVPQLPARSYGLGFGVGGGPGDRIIRHTGAQEGTRTALRIHPDEGRCYVFMTNSTWIDPSAYTTLLRDVGG